MTTRTPSFLSCYKAQAPCLRFNFVSQFPCCCICLICCGLTFSQRPLHVNRLPRTQLTLPTLLVLMLKSRGGAGLFLPSTFFSYTPAACTDLRATTVPCCLPSPVLTYLFWPCAVALLLCYHRGPLLSPFFSLFIFLTLTLSS